jgi:MFS family permease
MASPLLLTEICHPQHRGPLTAVYNCLWNGGALIVAWTGWGTSQIQNDWSWRSITFMQILPSVIQLAFIYWIPESPRFLISKERYGEALDILTYYHGGGNIKDVTAHFEFREIRETLQLEREITTGYLDFFRTRGNRHRLWILVSLGVISQYSGNALFSNYINSIYEGAGVTDQNTKLIVSGSKMILDLIVTVTAALNVDRFGRRPLFLVSLTGMVVSCALWMVCSILYENSGGTNITVGYVQLVFIWIFGIFYGIGFTGLLIAYAIEVLPFNLRAKGLTVMNICMQAVLAMSNQTSKMAWDNLPNHWNFILIYVVSSLFQSILPALRYGETHADILTIDLGCLGAHLRLLHVRRDARPDTGGNCAHLRRQGRRQAHQHDGARDGAADRQRLRPLNKDDVVVQEVRQGARVPVTKRPSGRQRESGVDPLGGTEVHSDGQDRRAVLAVIIHCLVSHFSVAAFQTLISFR